MITGVFIFIWNRKVLIVLKKRRQTPENRILMVRLVFPLAYTHDCTSRLFHFPDQISCRRLTENDVVIFNTAS